MNNYTKQDIINLAANLGICNLSEDWSGIDAVLPIIEKIKKKNQFSLLSLTESKMGKMIMGLIQLL